MIARLMKYEPDAWREVTLPAVGDTTYIHATGDCGEIVDYDDKSRDYRIKLADGAKIYAQAYDFKVLYDYALPMWGQCDLSDMHDDFGYYFGIDGAGYDFY